MPVNNLYLIITNIINNIYMIEPAMEIQQNQLQPGEANVASAPAQQEPGEVQQSLLSRNAFYSNIHGSSSSSEREPGAPGNH